MRLLLSILHVLLSLALAPLLLGIINRTKAVFGGRRGRPLLQVYFDLWKLAQKGAVYSRTTTWVFRTGPIVGLATTATALLVIPFAGVPALLAFPGDMLFFVYLLALGRFSTMAAALDTGSAFEGMGASREATFSALAEPALFLGLAALAFHTHQISLSGIFSNLAWLSNTIAPLGLVATAFFITLLVENSRIPFDDPETHLELTMIHEVMVLDHGGPDFALIQYGAALKLWILAAFITNFFVQPLTSSYPANLVILLGGQLVIAIGVGMVESVTARLRLLRVPQVLAGSAILSFMALFLFLRSLA